MKDHPFLNITVPFQVSLVAKIISFFLTSPRFLITVTHISIFKTHTRTDGLQTLQLVNTSYKNGNEETVIFIPKTHWNLYIQDFSFTLRQVELLKKNNSVLTSYNEAAALVGIKSAIRNTAWSLKSQSSFKKSKWIQSHHPFCSLYFILNGVYLLLKMGTIFKEGRFNTT